MSRDRVVAELPANEPHVRQAWHLAVPGRGQGLGHGALSVNFFSAPELRVPEPFR